MELELGVGALVLREYWRIGGLSKVKWGRLVERFFERIEVEGLVGEPVRKVTD